MPHNIVNNIHIKKVFVFSIYKHLTVDMVKFSVRKHLFKIYGRHLGYQSFVAVSFLTWESFQDRGLSGHMQFASS